MNVPLHDDLDTDLQRLIDGELSDAEYRELLQLLEIQPDGWKRCATAFLEAQIVGTELKALRQDIEGRPPLIAKPEFAWRGILPVALAVAASFLLTFTLTTLWHWTFKTPAQPTLASPPRALPETVRVDGLGMPDRQTGVTSIASSDQLPEAVTLLLDPGDGSVQQVQLPVLPFNERRADWIAQESTWVPPQVRQNLRQLGYEAHPNLRFAPIEWEGQQMVVPVGDVEIRPVGRFDYQ